MSESIISPTYYVLCNISTCPIAVPLQDYCREHSQNPELIKERWKLIKQIGIQGNEQIVLCCEPKKWSYINNQSIAEL